MLVGQSVLDIIRQILQSLQVPYLFPATLLVFATSILYPGQIGEDDASHAVIIIAGIVVLSYLLYAINIPIIRLIEGYSLEDIWLFRVTRRLEKRHHRNLTTLVQVYDEKINGTYLIENQLELYGINYLKDKVRDRRERWISERTSLQEQLQLRFPTTPRKLLPTALGNTIAAFEDYPWTRYNMDAVHLWPRMLPILEKKGFMQFIQSEKAILDFLLNTGLALLVICSELLLLFGCYRPELPYLALCGLLLLSAYALYRAATVAALHWGGMVRVAFDLYRDDLRLALNLPSIPDIDLDKERQLWKAVSQFIVHGEADDFKGFVYSRIRQE